MKVRKRGGGGKRPPPGPRLTLPLGLHWLCTSSEQPSPTSPALVFPAPRQWILAEIALQSTTPRSPRLEATLGKIARLALASNRVFLHQSCRPQSSQSSMTLDLEASHVAQVRRRGPQVPEISPSTLSVPRSPSSPPSSKLSLDRTHIDGFRALNRQQWR